MDIDDLLKNDAPPKRFKLSPDDLVKFFYKFKGLEKDFERGQAFWSSANKNMERAYKKIQQEAEDRKDAEEELEKKNKEMAKINSYMIGRELKMAELKREIKELKARLGEK